MTGAQDVASSSVLSAVNRYGLIEFFADDLIGGALRAYGEWAWLETVFVAGLFDELIESKRCVSPIWYDVGAFIGTFSLGLHALMPMTLDRPGVAGVAVEGNSESASMLQRNVQAHRRNSIAVVNEVIGLEGSKVVLRRDVGNRGGNSFAPSPQQDVGSGLSSSCVPLWRIRDKYGPYGLLKLDVEGMELEVIQSDQEWIAKNKPAIYAECNENPKSIALFELLLWLGYEVYFFSFPAFNPQNYFNVSRDLLFHDAHEAALVGVNGAVDCGAELREHGCVLKRLTSKDELLSALWFTPRYVPLEYRNLSLSELRAALTRLGAGLTREVFDRRLGQSPEAADSSIVGQGKQ